MTGLSREVIRRQSGQLYLVGEFHSLRKLNEGTHLIGQYVSTRPC